MSGPASVVPMAGGYLSALLDGSYWALDNPDGFPQRILEHLGYTSLAVGIALLVAFPLGVAIGHTGRGAFAVINLGNAGRALPTLGVLMLVLSLVGTGLLPVTVALVILAVPPILTTTYAGVRAVSPEVVDAARGMGMGELGIALRVEVPNALPIIIGGIRGGALQVVSTATLAAYVGLGGLGRYLFDGLALRDYPRVVAGGVVLAVLAVLLDVVIAVVARLVVSPGVDGRAARASGRGTGTRGTDATAAAAAESSQSAAPSTTPDRGGPSTNP